MSDYDADLAWALQAHHDAIVRHATSLLAVAEQAGVPTSHPDPYRVLRQLSAETSRIARELALGLEGLQRLIDSAKTVRLPISDIARATEEE